MCNLLNSPGFGQWEKLICKDRKSGRKRPNCVSVVPFWYIMSKRDSAHHQHIVNLIWEAWFV